MSTRINWSEEHLEARLNSGFYSGVRSGIEQTIARLRKRAGDAFANGQDVLAKTLREAAEDIEKEVLAGAKVTETRVDGELASEEAKDSAETDVPARAKVRRAP